MNQLNSEHLRTFLAILETGSVTSGAARIGRSQSATSLQVKQLEEVVGKPLFRRHGRGVTLTAAGEKLRPIAQQVTQSLDKTLDELRGEGLKGKVRMGMPDDHSRSRLARIISDFKSRHPEVELEVHCALGAGFADAITSGALDLAVHEVPDPGQHDEVLRKDHLVWMSSRQYDFADTEVLPIALFDRACWWRDLALSSVEEAGQRYKVIFTSESAVGVRAAVLAGMAVGLLSKSDSAEGLRPVPGLSSRHPTYLVLQRAPGQTAPGAIGPVCDAMCDAIRKAYTA
jgi:DNA-binding transcriptional LysR family regulator